LFNPSIAIKDPGNQTGYVLGVSANGVHNGGTECQKTGTLTTPMKKRRRTNRIENINDFVRSVTRNAAPE
jgi:hypothetical protein